MKLSVIIVSYNVRYFLDQCLWSVERACEQIESEIWVVDNASTDGSVEYLKPRHPQVHFISNAENIGFSRANNLAIRQCQGEYVLLLNPDTIVCEDTLQKCVEFLDTNTDVGATGVKMLQVDGSFAPESRRGLPTPFTSFCKMVGLCSLFPQSRVFGRYYLRFLPVGKAVPIEVISGAFNMLRRKALKQIGLLDEDFFMYGEDIDLSYRMILGGWQNYYLPLPILHYKGESTTKSSYRYVHVFYDAMLIFFNKHFGKKYFLLGYLIRAAVLLRAFMDLVIRFVEKLRGWLHCPAHYPAPEYVSYDLQKTTVSQMLRELESQPHGKRRVLETLFDGHIIIRPGEVKIKCQG